MDYGLIDKTLNKYGLNMDLTRGKPGLNQD